LTQQEAYQAKIERAMASIVERDGYCLVASESEQAAHIVTLTPDLHSQACTCKAAKSDLDCYHRIAVDRFYDDRRPAFHATIQPREFSYTDEEGERHAARRINWDEVLTPREKRATAPFYRPEGFSLLR
jgi:hypothetical protein